MPSMDNKVFFGSNSVNNLESVSVVAEDVVASFSPRRFDRGLSRKAIGHFCWTPASSAQRHPRASCHHRRCLAAEVAKRVDRAQSFVLMGELSAARLAMEGAAVARDRKKLFERP